MLASGLGADPSHLQLEILVLVVIVNKVDAVRSVRGEDPGNSHSGNFANGIATRNGFSAIRFTLHDLLQLGLGQSPSFSDGACTVSVVDAGGLNAEQLGAGLVHASN